ncbi:MAG: hypothetical protein ACRDVM_04110 [Acidimicrobiia bacterium]
MRLAGAVAGLRDVTGADIVDHVIKEFADIPAPFEALGPEAARRLVAEGRAMSVEAMASALEAPREA